MAEKEKIGNAWATTLHIGNVPIPKIVAGKVTVTGSKTITLPTSISSGAPGIVTISSVQATLGQAPVSDASSVSATWFGEVVTLSVWTSADAASSTATVVNYAIYGF